MQPHPFFRISRQMALLSRGLIGSGLEGGLQEAYTFSVPLTRIVRDVAVEGSVPTVSLVPKELVPVLGAAQRSVARHMHPHLFFRTARQIALLSRGLILYEEGIELKLFWQ